jgi:hypothetical protein
MSAAAVAGVGMLDAIGSTAAAADGDAVKLGQTSTPSDITSGPTRIANPSGTTHSSVLLQVDNATDTQMAMPGDTYAGVFATSTGHDQTTVKSLVGVLGMSDFGVGVRGHSDGDRGVVGDSTYSTGVEGTSVNGTGITATSSHGLALMALGNELGAIDAVSYSANAIHAKSHTQFGVAAEGPFGVVGTGLKQTGEPGGTGVGGTGDVGVDGRGTLIGVNAESSSGTGLRAASMTGSAVDATSTSGIAVAGESESAVGIRGTSTSGAGVHAVSQSGPGVLAESTTVGLVATSESGVGVRATSSTGVGLAAVSTQAVGGTFQGAAAAIRLVPRSSTGHPTTGHHQRGEIVVDHGGKVWVCTKPGTPGTWRRLAFV